MAPKFQSKFSISALLEKANVTQVNHEQNLMPNSPTISQESDESATSTSSNSIQKNHANEMKPTFTYDSLIVMAIQSSAEKRLPLRSIFKWISQNYPYYKKDDKGWKNSIRHNLSLNPLFIKLPRSLNDPGRGSYWTLDPTIHDLTIGQTTGRLRRKTSTKVNQDDNISSFRNKAVNYGAHTFRNMSVNNIMAHGYCPYTPNAVYFPTPDELNRMSQQTAYFHAQQQNQQQYQNWLLLQQQNQQLLATQQQQQQQQQYMQQQRYMQLQQQSQPYLTIPYSYHQQPFLTPSYTN